MNLAELKRRLQPGVRLRNTERLHKPELVGTVVTVKNNNSAGVVFDRNGTDAFMPWPKSTRMVGMGDGFKIFTDDGNHTLVEYVFMEEISTSAALPQFASAG